MQNTTGRLSWRILAGLTLIFALLPGLAFGFSGKVIHVADGDTITVRHEGITTRVRLAQIDCPEIRHGRRSGQPFGNAAKRFTLKAAAGKVVTVKGDKTDRYGRTIGEVILPDGTDLNRELVRVGLAWWYRHYSHDPPLGKLEQRARTAHLGLWSQPHPKPPWQYRHERRRRHH